jgi:hypothetical protein
MNTYQARFYGRKRNAIGIFYLINAIVEGKESITETVKNDVIKQIDKMPERWDGDVMINGL